MKLSKNPRVFNKLLLYRTILGVKINRKRVGKWCLLKQ